MIIAIDPGHPSREGDTGATSLCGRLVEADWTMGLARALRSAMLAGGEPFDPVLLRTRDGEVVSIPERARRATDAGADLVVSLHVDSWIESARRGATALYWPGNDEGRQVAAQVAASFPPVLRRESRGREASATGYPRAHHVLGAYPMTAVLIECGFASSPADVEALIEPAVQPQIVGALMQGVRLAHQLRTARWVA